MEGVKKREARTEREGWRGGGGWRARKKARKPGDEAGARPIATSRYTCLSIGPGMHPVCLIGHGQQHGTPLDTQRAQLHGSHWNPSIKWDGFFAGGPSGALWNGGVGGELWEVELVVVELDRRLGQRGTVNPSSRTRFDIGKDLRVEGAPLSRSS